MMLKEIYLDMARWFTNKAQDFCNYEYEEKDALTFDLVNTPLVQEEYRHSQCV